MLDAGDSYALLAKQAVIIRDEKQAWERLNALDPNEVYALDFETTSFRPEEGTVRLTSIAGENFCFVIDHWYVTWAPVAKFLSSRVWYVFNSLFEGNWIDQYSGNCDVQLWDVQHMKKAKMGGGPSSLAKMALDDLELFLGKTEQNSGWGNKELTVEQLEYAALDAIATYDIAQHWIGELNGAQWAGFHVINDAWRGTLRMELATLHVDVEYHKRIITLWQTKHDTAERYVRKHTPPSMIANLRSRKQLSDFFKKILDDKAIKNWPKTKKEGSDQLLTESKVLRQAAHRLPYPINRWMAGLVIFNYFEKYLSTYGEKLIWHMQTKGFIPTRFNMAQAITARYSSSAENLQNIPRNPVVRRSFTTLPLNGGISYAEMKRIVAHYLETGEIIKDIIVMVMADYSSIEVRVLAEVSGDKVLLHDAIYGDVHSKSASKIFIIDYDEFKAVLDDETHPLYGTYKYLRSNAKAFTFQLLYGAGAAALAIVLRCSDEDAAKAVEAWGLLYPKAYGYRQYMFEIMRNTGFLPVCDGKTIYVYRTDRTMPVASNYPIQGAAASVMYRAIYHTERWIRNCGKPITMRATVHDELILYSKLSTAKYAKEQLEKSMVKGWLDIFPGTDTTRVVEGKIGCSWGDK